MDTDSQRWFARTMRAVSFRAPTDRVATVDHSPADVPLFILVFGRQWLCVAVLGVVCVLFPSLVTLLVGLDNPPPGALDAVVAAVAYSLVAAIEQAVLVRFTGVG
jgi:hypothetical protein